MRQINKLYIVLIIVILTFIGYLYFSINSINEKISQSIKTVLISKAKYFVKNIEHELKLNIKQDPYNTLKKDEELRDQLTHTFSVIITPSFKYIYLLYKDREGRYRYLIDGSKEDKGDFNQKLNVDKEKWNRVYTTKKAQLLFQKNIDTLWITYLEPIIYNGKVEAVLAVDFSTKLLAFVNEIVNPIENIFNYIFILISILLLILLYQVILNIKTKKESITDPLTSLYNRNFLRGFLQKINPSKYHIAIMDIDHFKKINDNYGHKAGDYILTEVAYTLKEIIREEDTLIRFGGEEFLVFFHRDENTDIVHIANRIVKEFSEKIFNYEGNELKITLSIGVSSYPERYKNITEAIKEADEKLYIAKRGGRNQAVFENKKNILNSKILTIYEVKVALDEDNVFCDYQPIFDLKTEKIVKYEALVRIKDKNGKIFYPNSFLDTIANTNIYNDLTKRVFQIVTDKINRYKIAMSINLNLSDLLDNVIYNTLKVELQNNKKLLKWLTIELLEYEQIDTDIVKQRVEEIKSYGVTIALDDFGSGYSNFSVFQSLPIDILKIDGSLIKNIDSSKTSYYITESIVDFSKKLDIKVIAEFIHSKEVLDVIKTLDIDSAQGFYLAKPSPEII